MPTYVYRCRKCGHRFELFHSITDETLKRCPKCKGRADRVPAGGAGILFKGSGFYITDYRSSQYRERAKQEKSAQTGKAEGGSSKSDAGGKSGSGETKSGRSEKGGSSGKRGSRGSGE